MKIHIKILSFLLLFSLFIQVSSLFASANEVSISSISAKSACLIDAESGRVLYSKNSNQRLPMASTTKIMTAIVALESGVSLNTVINVPREAVGVEGSSVYLKYNEKVTFEMLLYALMLSSANDAAVAIAHTVSGNIEKFVDLMNQKAYALGLTNTHFTNPHGLYDDNHYTTAVELAKIMAYAMQNHDFALITHTYTKAFPRDDGTSFLLTNHNRLLKTNDYVIGGKTGFTKKSGRCLVTCAEQDKLKLIAVTLSASDDWNDHAELYNFGFANYKRTYFDAKTFKIPVISGNKSNVVVSNNEISMLMHKQDTEISVKIYAPKFLFADVKKGQLVGEIIYSCNDKIIATSPLYACEDVTKINYKFNFFDWLRNLFKGLFN